MAQISKFDDIINRISNGYTDTQPFYAEFQSTRQSMSMSASRMGWTLPIPNPLPTGVTAYRISKVISYSPGAFPLLIAKMVLLGTLTGAGSSPGTFVAGSGMPTATVLGAAGTRTYAGLWAEITTPISGTVTNFSTTWTDAGGTSRTLAVNLTTGAVAGSGGFLTDGTFNTQSTQASAVTAMSFTGASPTGVIKVYGAIPLAVSQDHYTTSPGVANNLTWQFQSIPLAAGDLISVIAPTYTQPQGSFGVIQYLGDT